MPLRAWSKTAPGDILRTAPGAPDALASASAAIASAFWPAVSRRTMEDASPPGAAASTDAAPRAAAGAPEFCGGCPAAIAIPDALTLDASMGSLNVMLSAPSLRSRDAATRRGGVVSLLNDKARSPLPAKPLPDTSSNAPAAISRWTGPFDPLAWSSDEACAGTSSSTAVRPSAPRDAAPDRDATAVVLSAPSTDIRDASAVAARTYSSNVIESVRAATLSRGGAPGSSSGGAPSLSTAIGAPLTRGDGFHDRSANAPADAFSAMSASAPAHSTAAAFWAGVSARTTPGEAPGGTPAAAPGAAGGAGETPAPSRPVHSPPPPPPAAAVHRDALEGSDADALTYSPNHTVSVPLSRSSDGGIAVLSAGATESVAIRTASCIAPLGFSDRSSNAPAAASSIRTDAASVVPAHATAAAFWAGVSASTMPSEAPGAAGRAASGAGEAAAPPSPTASPPPRHAPSDIRDALAADALTCSSNRTASVPAPRSSEGGSAPSNAGAAVSPATSSCAACAALGFPERS